MCQCTSTICLVSVLAFFLTVNQALQSTNKDFLEDTVWVCWSRGVKNWDKLNALVKTHLLKYMLEGHVHCAFSIQYQNTKVYITSHAFVYFTGWRNQCKEWDQFQRLLFERSPEKQELIAVLWFNSHPVLTGLPPPPQYFLGTLLVQWIVTVVFRNLPCYFPQVTNYAHCPLTTLTTLTILCKPKCPQVCDIIKNFDRMALISECDNIHLAWNRNTIHTLSIQDRNYVTAVSLSVLNAGTVNFAESNS